MSEAELPLVYGGFSKPVATAMDWHGTYEVAERFYRELIPQAREIIHRARAEGKADQAQVVDDLIETILARPEHQWFEEKTKPKSAGGKLPGQ